MPSGIQSWLEKVYKSRLITNCLRIDLLHIDKLYTRISKCKYDLYNLRKEVNLEYVSVGGVVSCKDDEVRKQLEEKETKHNIEIAELRSSVDDIVTNRVKLISSELKQWKSRRGRDYLTKSKLKRQKRGCLVIVGELKNTSSLYTSLAKERDMLHLSVTVIFTFTGARANEDCMAYKRERQRERINLHNFTARDISYGEKQILNCGGGFVMKGMCTEGAKKKRAVKRETELAILNYVEYLAGSRKNRRGLVKRDLKSLRRINVRKEIMRYYFHPRIGYLERRFITKALKLTDFLYRKSFGANHIQSKPVIGNPVLTQRVKRKESHLKGLKLLKELSQDDNFVLRESDKNLGWSLNTSSWYKQEYIRHLQSGFYHREGSLEDVNSIKQKCRDSLGVLLRKHRGILTKGDFQSFNLGNNDKDDYILPSLNLLLCFFNNNKIILIKKQKTNKTTPTVQ